MPKVGKTHAEKPSASGARIAALLLAWRMLALSSGATDG